MSFKASNKAANTPNVESARNLGADAAAAFDALSDGIIIISDAGEVVFLNRAAARMNEIDRDAAVGRPLVDTVEASAIDWTDICDAIETRKKAEIISKNDLGRPFLTSLRKFRGAGGEGGGVLISQRDLEVFDHDRRRASSGSADNTFRFLNDRALRPDFARQRARSADLERLLSHGERAMQQGARVLLLGESGAGKTEIARHLNDFLSEQTAPFIHVNCGAIPDTLFESEMFGYERGSFTGALQSGKQGLIEAADGGTLFLDEVAEIPHTIQAKLLKFLEDGSVQRIGASKGKQVRARVISATNKDIEAMVADGTFRRDLYYRLAVISLEVRALRETPELIDHLINRFLQVVNQRRPERLEISAECRNRLASYSFPGNIRELHNLVQHLSVIADRVAEVRDLPESVLLDRSVSSSPLAADLHGWNDAGLKEQVKAYELQLIEQAIALHGSKRKAADALGVDIGTVVRKTQAKH